MVNKKVMRRFFELFFCVIPMKYLSRFFGPRQPRSYRGGSTSSLLQARWLDLLFLRGSRKALTATPRAPPPSFKITPPTTRFKFFSSGVVPYLRPLPSPLAHLNRTPPECTATNAMVLVPQVDATHPIGQQLAAAGVAAGHDDQTAIACVCHVRHS